jgi:hypothetical protein
MADCGAPTTAASASPPAVRRNREATAAPTAKAATATPADTSHASSPSTTSVTSSSVEVRGASERESVRASMAESSRCRCSVSDEQCACARCDGVGRSSAAQWRDGVRPSSAAAVRRQRAVRVRASKAVSDPLSVAVWRQRAQARGQAWGECQIFVALWRQCAVHVCASGAVYSIRLSQCGVSKQWEGAWSRRYRTMIGVGAMQSLMMRFNRRGTCCVCTQIIFNPANVAGLRPAMPPYFVPPVGAAIA